MRIAIVAMAVTLASMTGPLSAETQKAPPADVGSGRIAWFDVTTKNLPQSKEFYGKLFDWQFTAVQGTDQALEIVAGGTPIGTIRVAEGQISGHNGVVYVQVPDIQAACGKAKELGASVVPGFPFDLPGGIGAICLFMDPSGHPMGLYSRAPIQRAPGAPGK